VFSIGAMMLASTALVRADSLPTLSGQWSATALRSAWNVGDWGEACGPRPAASSDAGGTVQITQKGSELVMSGLGRSYSTNQCWEQFPGLRTSTHSGSVRSWRNTCKTAAGDPRQATIITTLSATDTTISFDETGQYQFVLKGQNCTASVRRTRTFKLVQREGSAPAAVQTGGPSYSLPKGTTNQPKTTTTTLPTTRDDRCAQPGPPARLEVRPARKLMRPGESFDLRALVLDGKGCTLSTPVTWSVAGAGPVTVDPKGQVHVADDAPEREVDVTASVAHHAVDVRIEIASRERYEALLQQRGFNQQGESSEAAVAAIASGAIGASAAEGEATSRSRRLRFVLVITGAALALAVVGLVLVRRRSRAPSAMQDMDRTRVSAPDPIAGPPPVKICPTCREEYPPNEQFCARDGNRLVTAQPAGAARGPIGGVCPVCGQGFDPGIGVCPIHHESLVPPGVYQSPPAAPSRKICPVCGTQYPGDGRFCGVDGALLVPVN
jgi:hypothetical protein